MLGRQTWPLVSVISLLCAASTIPDCTWNHYASWCREEDRAARIIYNITSERCEARRVCEVTVHGTFSSLNACRSQCECPVLPDLGNCGKSQQRFLYDPAIGRCRRFEFRGCGQHFNNFETLSECKSACICATSHDPHACSRPGPPCFYFDSVSFQCRQDNSPGCGITFNRFRSLEHCRDECICSLEYAAGRCTGYVPFYYYNKWSERCEWFYYTGCGGNGNRFWTETECRAACPVWRRRR